MNTDIDMNINMDKGTDMDMDMGMDIDIDLKCISQRTILSGSNGQFRIQLIQFREI
jgi:hypothetical protein